MADFALRVQTMLYATYMFVSGIAILVFIEVVHLARRRYPDITPLDAE
jgi:hypothetical protein